MSQTVPRHQRPTTLKTFLFGAPYYPEHDTPKDRGNDPELLAKAGVNIVRMAEFAWDRIEPSRGKFDFSLFDESIDRLGKHGIKTMLCTPTATPPRWLTIDHPDWMRVDANGKSMEHGSRQHCCTNNREFRSESRRITRAMADHYSSNPYVAGWQTDNEMFCHFSECYCPACLNAFCGFLRTRYATIAELNVSWGCSFWAQTYDTFDQIPFPYLPDRPTHPNPGHLLDYYRFLGDGLIGFQREQVDILRKANPGWWKTHNGMFGHIDYWRFTEDLDFLGIDMYPGFGTANVDDAWHQASGFEHCRAASGNFVVPECQGGAGGQRTYIHDTPRPGQMRLWAYQAIAHGADSVQHFRWRTCRFGAEMYWNGILDHDNVPRRRYDEFSQEGNELKKIGDKILGTVEFVKAAILIDQDQEEVHGTMHCGLPSPHDQRLNAYREFWNRRIPAGFVNIADSFARLDVIIVPSFTLIDETLASKLTDFARAGGTVVALARTATRDRRNQVLDITPPGFLHELFGITVEEFGKLNHGSIVKVRTGAKRLLPVCAYEILKPSTARPLATWSATDDGGPHAAAGKPAITVSRIGKGQGMYIGTYLTKENAEGMIGEVLKQVKLPVLGNADPGVEITCRFSEARRLYFVLNHFAVAKEATGLPPGVDLLSGKKCAGTLRLPGYGVAIIEAARDGKKERT
jgi:beta-galactosidase